MWVTRNTVLSDSWSYMGLAEGILHGEYSMWWPLGTDHPDTFRTPGYPLLLAITKYLFGNWRAIVLFQLVLYAASVILTLRTIALWDPRPITGNLFLCLLIPMLNVPFYINQLYAEIPVLFCITLAVWWAARPERSYVGALGLGLLFGVTFQFRPIFLLFPVLFFAAMVIRSRGARVLREMATLLTFGLTLLPFGVWNYQNHGVFQVTPLEGSGYYVNFGHWSGLLPKYTEHVYWHNTTGDELVRFVSDEERRSNIAKFEAEWEEINAQLAPLLTENDSIMRASADGIPYRPSYTFTTEYTRAREALLMERGIAHLYDDPWYTVKRTAFTAVRIWVIGIQVEEFRKASAAGKAQMLFATSITALYFVLFLIIVPLAWYKGRLLKTQLLVPILFLCYFWFIHLPFPIQSRYTVPVRLLMLAFMAISASGLLFGNARNATNAGSSSS